MYVCICVLCAYVYCACGSNFIIMVLLGTTCLLHSSFQKRNSITSSSSGQGNLQASVSGSPESPHQALRGPRTASPSTHRSPGLKQVWQHGLQHPRPPCPSLTPEVCSNSCPSGRWLHPTISSSVDPLLLPTSIFPSIRVFSNEAAVRIRWPKYWSFLFSISPSNEYSGLISFRMDWLDLPAVQGTLKSLLQRHSSKASILWCSAFFMVQLLHPYMTTGKTIALTRQTFVSKAMSLLFIFYFYLFIYFFGLCFLICCLGWS